MATNETSPRLAERPLGEVIDALAADRAAPGAGAAGAIALALAAACAAKAVAITLKRRPDEPALQRRLAELRDLSHAALELGQQDAVRFERYLRSRDEEAAALLERNDAALARSCARLMALLDVVEADSDPVVRGDAVAAQWLVAAAAAIQAENESESAV